MWWRFYYAEISRVFPGELWSVCDGARKEFGTNWLYGHPKGGGLATDGTSINCGKNSGFQALGLAHLFGCSRVTLLGYDMSLGPHGKSHWHGDHPKGKLNNGGGSRFPVWRREMDELARDLRRTTCTVVNASRVSALKCFPRVPLEQALCM